MRLTYKYILTESLDDGAIRRITLNRPEARNAQNRGMLVELNDAFLEAEHDDDVKVIILAAAGPIFSSGHDLGSKIQMGEMQPGPDQHISFRGNGGTRKSVEKRDMQEWKHFLHDTLRWRNLRKITVAQVHGQVVSAGLMLMWACDLIVAAEGTIFYDVVGTRLGMAGMEYFAHPWEFGPRKTKELMLTSDAIDADEAHRLGMVSKIYPPDQLAEKTLEYARRIASVPTMAALMIKESVNQSVDNMGFYNALNACFTLHQLNHAHWSEQHVGTEHEGIPCAVPSDGAIDWRNPPPIQLARVDS
jgi:enoyl-CoA hydratase